MWANTQDPPLRQLRVLSSFSLNMFANQRYVSNLNYIAEIYICAQIVVEDDWFCLLKSPRLCPNRLECAGSTIQSQRPIQYFCIKGTCLFTDCKTNTKRHFGGNK
jgi:hypothetical protein